MASLKARYAKANKEQRSKILDEFVAATCLPAQAGRLPSQTRHRGAQRQASAGHPSDSATAEYGLH